MLRHAVRGFASSLVLLAGALPVWSQAPQTHDANTVFKTLIDKGVPWRDQETIKFAAPVLADGLTGAAQQQALMELLKKNPNNVNATELFQAMFSKDLQAPYDERRVKVKATRAENVHRLDLYFVAYGDLEVLGDRNFMKEQFKIGGTKGLAKIFPPESGDLTDEELNARKLAMKPATDKLRDGYPYATFTIGDKVRVSVTAHAMETKTGESTLVASLLDPTFALPGEKKHPNQWQAGLVKGETFELGPVQPYSCTGSYVKVTKLQLPDYPGTLFFEYHLVFAEPFGWFGGREGEVFRHLGTAYGEKIRKLRRDLKDAGNDKATGK